MAGVPALAMLFSPGVVGTIIARSASPEQQRRWLPGVASGELRLSFAITEADAGTNAHNIATVARIDPARPDHYVLSGRKQYITGVESADHVMVVARTGTDPRTGRAQLSVLMVDADAPGLERTRIPTVMNQPDQSWQLFFDDVLVPADQLVGAEGKGLAVAFTGMNTERILTSSICTGVGRYALRKAVAYAREREVWGTPIGAHQAVAHPLALAHVHMQAALLMTEEACRRHDAGDEGPEVGELANMAKLLGSQAGLEALDAAIQTHGGNGVALEYQLATYYFIVRMLNIGPVSSEMILNFVAERSLGLPRSY
jgi:alkylation response protein AidB-like acyl-CoA dehydrogenase